MNTADDVIAQAKTALEGVTEGPWTWDEDSEYLIDPHGEQVPSNPRANTDFIAAARDLVPSLIELAEAQDATIVSLRGLVGVWRQMARANRAEVTSVLDAQQDKWMRESVRADRAEATIARVRALVTGGEQREATSLTRMFNGDPFPALFTTADIRAALDGEGDQ